MHLPTMSKTRPARELAFLKTAFHLATKHTPPKARFIPYIPMLKENNTRKGFLKKEQFVKLANACANRGLWLRTILELTDSYGWRKGEVLNLRVEQIDLIQQVIHLDPGETKNDDGRTIKTTQEAYNLLAACIAGKEPADLAITRQDGSPVGDFRCAWRSACAEAGVPGLRIHDLRRTGCRNMRRLGFDESVIMKVGGWKTASVFKRYNIVDERDIAEVAAKLDEKRKKQHEDGHSSGIVEGSGSVKPESREIN